MGRDAIFLKQAHQVVGNLVVDNPLFGDRAFFQTVKRGRVVLVINDVGIGIIGFKHLFRFSFIKLFQFFHNYRLLLHLSIYQD